jgi:hypothetical protein
VTGRNDLSAVLSAIALATAEALTKAEAKNQKDRSFLLICAFSGATPGMI